MFKIKALLSCCLVMEQLTVFPIWHLNATSHQDTNITLHVPEEHNKRKCVPHLRGHT